MVQYLHALEAIARGLGQVPVLLLGASVIILPVLLLLFKRKRPFAYGIWEVIFSIALGLAAAAKISLDYINPSAWLAFIAAMYVGQRGWQNASEAWERKHKRPVALPAMAHLPEQKKGSKKAVLGRR